MRIVDSLNAKGCQSTHAGCHWQGKQVLHFMVYPRKMIPPPPTQSSAVTGISIESLLPPTGTGMLQ